LISKNPKERETQMELTRENVLKWFEGYFKDINKNQGDLETVPNLKKYFTTEIEFLMYTSPRTPTAKRPVPREHFLMFFVHPGLFEELIPRYFVVDVEQMIVVVQFEIRFGDKPSSRSWPPIQASAHYHLKLEENKELRIGKIHYWTEALPEEVFEFWAKRRDDALTEYAMSYINANP
jgi:hypothetical protein